MARGSRSDAIDKNGRGLQIGTVFRLRLALRVLGQYHTVAHTP